MKVNEIIEQCNELLEDKWYYLQTIELTKEEVKVLLEEIERLNNIIKEVREYIEKHIWTDSEYPYYMEMASEDYDELLEILDKENKWLIL